MTAQAEARRPRGRPQRLPYDDAPATAHTVDGTKRLAWVLATRRILAPDGAPNRNEFVARVRDLGIKADSSRISRWESGLEPLPERLVRAYEPCTGAAPYSLVAVQRQLARTGHMEVRLEPRHAGNRTTPQEFDELMDRIQTHSMHGDLWLKFADAVHDFDHLYLHHRAWRATTDLMVEELARSSGLGYTRRFEAAVSLLRHPTVRPHLARSIGQFTLDPGSQMVVRALAVLGEEPDAGVNDLLLRMVSTAEARLSTSAALIASHMVARGHFSGEERVLVGHVLRALGAPRPRLPATVLDLACRLGEEPFRQALAAVADPGERQRLARARRTGKDVDAEVGRSASEQVADFAERQVGRPAHEPDPMLRRLIHEALFHTHADRRELATSLLLASPYAEAVGEGALEVTTSDDHTVASSSWALVRRLAHVLQPGKIHAQARAERRPAMMAKALACVAWARNGMTDDLAAWVGDLVTATPDPRLGVSGVAVLGMHRRHEQLARVDNPDLRPAAAWWRTAGGAIHER